MSDEEFVRESWDAVWVDQVTGYLHLELNPAQTFTTHETSLEGSWSAAAEFTSERLEQIRQVTDAIEWTKETLGLVASAIRDGDSHDASGTSLERSDKVSRFILSRLEAIRDDLKKGMK